MDISEFSTIPTVNVCVKIASESILAQIRSLTDLKQSVWKRILNR